MNFQNQLTRIRRKLPLARIFDQDFAAFGASTHRYELGEPVAEAEVAAFEVRYGIELPPCYRAFVTEIGSGGFHPAREGAGPAHGLYAFGTGVDEVVDSALGGLQQPVVFHAGFTAESWSQLVRQRINAAADNDYDESCARLYAGILSIGHQGESGFQGLLLNGPLRGRVLYYFQEPELLPELSAEANFLDWYERWLDGVIRNVPLCLS